MNTAHSAEIRFARTSSAVIVRPSTQLEKIYTKIPYIERLHRLGGALVIAKDFALTQESNSADCLSFLTLNKGIRLTTAERILVERLFLQIREQTIEIDRYNGMSSSAALEELLVPSAALLMSSRGATVEAGGPIVWIKVPFEGLISLEDSAMLIVTGQTLCGRSVGLKELRNPQLVRRVFYINSGLSDEAIADTLDHEKNHVLFDLFPLGLCSNEPGTVSNAGRMKTLNDQMAREDEGFKARLGMMVEFARLVALSEVRVRVQELLNSGRVDFDPESLRSYKPSNDIDAYCRMDGYDPIRDTDLMRLIITEMHNYYRLLGTVKLMINSLGVASTLQIISLLDYNDFEKVRAALS